MKGPASIGDRVFFELMGMFATCYVLSCVAVGLELVSPRSTDLVEPLRWTALGLMVVFGLLRGRRLLAWSIDVVQNDEVVSTAPTIISGGPHEPT